MILKKIIKENRSHNIIGVISIILAVLLVIALYWRWALPGFITLGDWSPVVSKNALADFSLVLWNSGGLGNYIIQGIPFHPLGAFSGFLSRSMHYDGAPIELLVIFLPFIFILIISPLYLARVLGFTKIGISATIIVFNLNSIMFLIAAVPTLALAIASGPLVIATFIQAIHSSRLRNCLLFGLALSLQMFFDVRIAYVGVVFCFLYLVYHVFIVFFEESSYNFRDLFKKLSLMALIVFLLHSYWIIPFLEGKVSHAPVVSLPAGYNDAGWVRTLSYWNLLHVLGLQAISWGRPYTFNPPNAQFLFFPILAFSIFLFPLGKKKRIFLFFGLAALVFSFLAKGSKPPFGEFYIWLFLHFPGFSMFREPGKWWFPVLVSYTALIGGLAEILINGKNITILSGWLKERFKISLAIVRAYLGVSAIALFFLIFPVNPISTLYYSGIYEPRPVPEEAHYLDDFLHSQPDFSRILWLPMMFRYGYFSSQHPAVSSAELGQGLLSSLLISEPNSYPEPSSYLKHSFVSQILRLFSVRYIVVPFVPTGQSLIYYWYESAPEYFQYLANKASKVIPYAFKGKSKVYEIQNSLPHIYTALDSGSYFIVGNYGDVLPIVFKVLRLQLKPLIIISGQNHNIQDSPLSSRKFVFQDRDLGDFALELTNPITIFFSIFKNKDKSKLSLKIFKPGTYELWIDTESIKFESAEVVLFEIIFDRKVIYRLVSDKNKLNINKTEGHSKYSRMAELNVKAGQHAIEIRAKDKNGKIPISSVLLLTEKSKRLNQEKSLTQSLRNNGKDISYIFSRSSDFTVR